MLYVDSTSRQNVELEFWFPDFGLIWNEKLQKHLNWKATEKVCPHPPPSSQLDADPLPRPWTQVFWRLVHCAGKLLFVFFLLLYLLLWCVATQTCRCLYISTTVLVVSRTGLRFRGYELIKTRGRVYKLGYEVLMRRVQVTIKGTSYKKRGVLC